MRIDYFDEHAYAQLSGDTTMLPSCLLWPSDRALAEPPWNQRFRGLGFRLRRGLLCAWPMSSSGR